MNPEWFYCNVFRARDVPKCLLIIFQSTVDVMMEISHISVITLCCQLQSVADGKSLAVW